MSIEERLERIEKLVMTGFKKVLSVADVAMMMGISESRVRHMVSEQDIPSYKSGGKLYFNREELENHLLRNRRPSRRDIECQATTRMVIERMK